MLPTDMTPEDTIAEAGDLYGEAVAERSYLTKADLDAELDYAFGLFEPGPDGCVDEAELRRLLQNPHTGAALDEAELDLLTDVVADGDVAEADMVEELRRVVEHFERVRAFDCW